MAETPDHKLLELPEFAPPPSVLIVVAPYYAAIAEQQIRGAKAMLGKVDATVDVIEVPGALEIPTAIGLAAEANSYEGYVALGCVIRGETTHYDTVCNDSSRALSLLGIDRGLCIGNGILTCENMAQAEARANPSDMDKGGGAAAAALHLVALARKFRQKNSPSGGDGPGSHDEFMMAAARQPRTA